MAPKKELLAMQNLIVSRIENAFELSLFKIQTKTIEAQYRDITENYIKLIRISTDTKIVDFEKTRKHLDVWVFEILSKLE